MKNQKAVEKYCKENGINIASVERAWEISEIDNPIEAYEEHCLMNPTFK